MGGRKGIVQKRQTQPDLGPAGLAKETLFAPDVLSAHWRQKPGYTQIRAQILGGNGQTVSQPGAKSGESNLTESLVNGGICHVLSQPVTSCQMERVKGIEPSTHIVVFL